MSIISLKTEKTESSKENDSRVEKKQKKTQDFLKLWIGESISLFGSQVSLVAFPFTAVITLHASPQQLGLLNALQFAPFLLFTLFAGIWVDRAKKRNIIIAANIGRAFLLSLIPLAFLFHLLNIFFANLYM